MIRAKKRFRPPPEFRYTETPLVLHTAPSARPLSEAALKVIAFRVDAMLAGKAPVEMLYTSADGKLQT